MPDVSLLNIDCMEYMAGLEDNAFELAIVDPPYGIDINSSGRLGHYGERESLGMIIPRQTNTLRLCAG